MASSAVKAHDAHDGGHGEDHGGDVHVHIASTWFYIGILVALLFLTIITVSAAQIDFGSGNTIIAVGIATVKASLVAAFFMHLRHDKLFNTLAFLAAFLFLSIFLLLTHDDLGTRGQVDDAYGTQRMTETGKNAPGTIELSAPPSAEPEKEGAPAAPGKDGKEGAQPAPEKH
jgi:cytochrome c oxidase subunit 4